MRSLIALLFLAGCHGADVKFGVGHRDGGSSYSHRAYPNSLPTYRSDDDGSTSGWVELSLQLSPKSHRVDLEPKAALLGGYSPNGPPSNLPVEIPPEPEPEVSPEVAPEVPSIDLGLADRLSSLESRLDESEGRLKRLGGWKKLLIGGGGGTGRLATLAYLAILHRRRRASNGEAVEEAE